MCCFPELTSQIHRNGCHPLFRRELQGVCSEVCNPAADITNKYRLDSFILHQYFQYYITHTCVLCFSSSRNVLPDSRVNTDFPKWSTDGEINYFYCMNVRKNTLIMLHEHFSGCCWLQPPCTFNLFLN